MQRSQVVQGFLDLFTNPRYLEIGVNSGEKFLSIRAATKVAVDPHFLLDTAEAETKDPSSHYHEITSDEFFASVNDGGKFDVVYLDGLHTFEQTLRDLLNTLAVVHENSVIVIDDVLPSGHCAAISDLSTFFKVHELTHETRGDWMGDVYRLVYFIDTFMPMLSYATVSDNHGQTVVWREPRRVSRQKSVESVARTPFTDTVLDRTVFNLTPCHQIVDQVLRSRSDHHQSKPAKADVFATR